jgi:hypothetical protein
VLVVDAAGRRRARQVRILGGAGGAALPRVALEEDGRLERVSVLVEAEPGMPSNAINGSGASARTRSLSGSPTRPARTMTSASAAVSARDSPAIRSYPSSCTPYSWSHPGSSSRVTPAHVVTGANSGSPAGAVTSIASATARERNGPITARAAGSLTAAVAAAT